MHIPDGYLSMPINAACGAASVIVLGAALWKARELGEKQVPLLGVTSAFVFAAQMLNYPVAGGTSGHFLGAALAAVLLGPLEACLVLAVVLVIQCLMFADGGLLALGANVFNMGVIGGIGAWLIFRLVRSLLPQTRAAMSASAAVAAWSSVMLAAAACSLELVLSGVEPASHVFGAMLGVHAIIGAGEAIITATVVGMVLAVRPDLVGGAGARAEGGAA